MSVNSPIPHEKPPVTIEEDPRKDKSYRRYASNVERALSMFDTALQEWADYIAFLGRLLKALQSSPSNHAEIPHKATVAKRLAQCLDPVLPSGVHQKTLEVYAYVFAVLDSKNLAEDLSLYLPGLSPTLSFASLSVKPALLSLFETFIIPLNPAILRSALKAIILSLLPGLEEDSSDEFERTLALLNKFRNAIGKDLRANGTPTSVTGTQYFWQSLFLASITSPSRRQGALAYMTREFPRLGESPVSHNSSNDIIGKETLPAPKHVSSESAAVTAPEPGLMIRCFAAGLQDEQLLIQRGFLDLLVSHVPLHSAILHQTVVPGDLELLVAAASSVVARREMSLNRRLWTWFLGPEPSAGPENPLNPLDSPNINKKGFARLSQTDYFEAYGVANLESAILTMFNRTEVIPSVISRPFRICLSLMDRWEVGSLVIPRILIPAMESVYRYQSIAPSKEAFSEVLRSATVFFDGIEPSLIWAELVKDFVQSLHNRSLDRVNLTLFIITTFNVKEEEMLTLHIPLATITILIRLCEIVGKGTKSTLMSTEDKALIHAAFKVATKLLDLIPQRVLKIECSETSLPETDNSDIVGKIQNYYHEVQAGTEDITFPMAMDGMGTVLLQNASQFVVHALRLGSGFLDQGLIFLDKLVQKSPGLAVNDYESLMSSVLWALLECRLDETGLIPFPTVSALVLTSEVIQKSCHGRCDLWHSDHRTRQLLPGLLKQLWAYTYPGQPKHAVEAVRCIWRLHSISPDSQLVEGSITTLMLEGENGDVAQKVHINGARRFATIWAHSGSTSTTALDQSRHVSHSARSANIKAANNYNEQIIMARPLLMILDSLAINKNELSVFVTSWLQSLPSIEGIIRFLIFRLRKSPYIDNESLWKSEIDEEADGTKDDALHNVSESVYYLRTISNLVGLSSTNIWTALNSSIDMTDPSMGMQRPTDGGLAQAPGGDENSTMTIYNYLARLSLRALRHYCTAKGDPSLWMANLRQTSVSLAHHLVVGQPTIPTLELTFKIPLLEALSSSVEHSDIMLQMSLMDLLIVILDIQLSKSNAPLSNHRRASSRDTIRSMSQLSLSIDRGERDSGASSSVIPPPALLECLILGISSPDSHPIVDHWIHFLNSCLPLYADCTFQTLMPLVDCFTRTIDSVFRGLRATFEADSIGRITLSEPIIVLNALLNGLEQVLAGAHDHLLQDEGQTPSIRNTDQAQSFFGNMVSGVFAPEAQKSRSTTANNRLTVIICFKDAVRICFTMWSWGDAGVGSSPQGATTAASFNYTSLRLRNRTRRMLEHLFAAEPLECLETLVEFWHRAGLEDRPSQSSTVLYLLHALEGSRPKNTIPALFNAIYSRTNPNVLDPVRKSTLTSELSDISLVKFLAAYTRSMEDDALDEIWTDCMSFLRDVLGNPLPQRQTLPLLLEFTAILGEKINNTNFGEQRKMRRDIGELFVRLLAATFTTKPLAFLSDAGPGVNELKSLKEPLSSRVKIDPEDVVTIIAGILPNISKFLLDTDRIVAATTTISTQIVVPTIKWKTFPRNITSGTLDILIILSRIPEASKTWRKDVADAFNDARFFSMTSLELVQNGWMRILRQWGLQEKERMPELLSRLSSPSSAGIMFGVGATSARQEADRKSQLNLRRIALLLLSADHDAYIVHLKTLQEKLVEIMTATAASSPSAATRAEVYMVFRALILKVAPVHLSSFWPTINSELQGVLSSLSPAGTREAHNIFCVLQAAKLLDTLLTISPDDFQLREWLFITDTIDAVHRPAEWTAVALVDAIAEGLDSKAIAPQSATKTFSSIQGSREPLISWEAVQDVPKEDIFDRILRPFLRQLSMTAFESTYRMEIANREVCIRDLVQDMFDNSTVV